MKPVQTPETNATYAEQQPQYLDLPVHKSEDGRVTSCWELSDEDFATVMRTRRIFLTVLTFNKPLQPQRPHVRFEERV